MNGTSLIWTRDSFLMMSKNVARQKNPGVDLINTVSVEYITLNRKYLQHLLHKVR